MMLTYRVDLLNALGIDYEGWSEFLVMRGKRYKRGPSFTMKDYHKAAEYCLSNNLQGDTCILVDNSIELTAWLHRQNSNSAETQPIDEAKSISSDQKISQQKAQSAPKSKKQMIYRGVKYDVSKQQ